MTEIFDNNEKFRPLNFSDMPCDQKHCIIVQTIQNVRQFLISFLKVTEMSEYHLDWGQSHCCTHGAGNKAVFSLP